MNGCLDRLPGWRPADLIPSFGFARCYGCHRPWWWIEKVDPAPAHHSVGYAPGASAFALCERCWKRSTTEQRIVAYQWLFEQWGRPDPEEWQACEANIRAG